MPVPHIHTGADAGLRRRTIGQNVFGSGSRALPTPSLIRSDNVRPASLDLAISPAYTATIMSDSPSSLSPALHPAPPAPTSAASVPLFDADPSTDRPPTPPALVQPSHDPTPTYAPWPYPPPSPPTPILPARAPHGYAPAFAPLFAPVSAYEPLSSHLGVSFSERGSGEVQVILPYVEAENISGLTKAQERQLEGVSMEERYMHADDYEESAEVGDLRGTLAPALDLEKSWTDQMDVFAPSGAEEQVDMARATNMTIPGSGSTSPFQPMTPLYHPQQLPALPESPTLPAALPPTTASLAAFNIDSYYPTPNVTLTRPSIARASSGPAGLLAGSQDISDRPAFDRAISHNDNRASSSLTPRAARKLNNVNAVWLSVRPGLGGALSDVDAHSEASSDDGEDGSEDNVRSLLFPPSFVESKQDGSKGALMNALLERSHHTAVGDADDGMDMDAAPLVDLDSYDDVDYSQPAGGWTYSQPGSLLAGGLQYTLGASVGHLHPGQGLQSTYTIPASAPSTSTHSQVYSGRFPNIAKASKSSSPPVSDDDTDGEEDEEGSDPSVRHSSPVHQLVEEEEQDTFRGSQGITLNGAVMVEQEGVPESGSDSEEDIPLARQRQAAASDRAAKVTATDLITASLDGSPAQTLPARPSTRAANHALGRYRWSNRLAMARTVTEATAKPATDEDGNGSDSDTASDSGSAYEEPTTNNKKQTGRGARGLAESSDESDIESDDSQFDSGVDHHAPTRKASGNRNGDGNGKGNGKGIKRGAGKLKRKAGHSDLKTTGSITAVSGRGTRTAVDLGAKAEQTLFAQSDRKREPDCQAKMDSLRDRLMGVVSSGAGSGSSQGGGTGRGGAGYKAFDVRLCMLMADDRFADVIKWDTSGRAMVIEDFQLFWARACKYVMRKETQQSAFDKQLSNHGFKRHTEESQSRKCIAHPLITAADAELWAAVKEQPRLEACDEKKPEGTGRGSKTTNKTTKVKAERTASGPRQSGGSTIKVELSVEPEIDVLRHENADLRLELKGKDEVIERLRAALVGMGVRGDGVDPARYGLLPGDMPTASSGLNENGKPASIKPDYPGAAFSTGPRLLHEGDIDISPAQPSIMHQASSASLQTLVNPTPSRSFVNVTEVQTAKADVGSDAGTAHKATPLKAKPANARGHHNLEAYAQLTAPAKPNTENGADAGIGKGKGANRKRKSTSQLVPPASPSPMPLNSKSGDLFPLVPCRRSSGADKENHAANHPPARSRASVSVSSSPSRVKCLPGAGLRPFPSKRLDSSAFTSATAISAADSAATSSCATSPVIAAPAQPADTTTRKGRRAFPSREVSKIPPGASVVTSDMVAVLPSVHTGTMGQVAQAGVGISGQGKSRGKEGEQVSGQVGVGGEGPRRKRSRLSKA